MKFERGQMKNIKIVVQYEGTRYQGWQRQESTGNTLQGKLEAILTKMSDQKIELQASGRTDAGVHSYGQTANFHIDTAMEPSEIMNYLNQYLPEDIAVIQAVEVDHRFHSRLNAKRKTYCYRVLNSGIPHIFDRRYTYQVSEKLDVEAMRKAAACFIGKHDFKAFTSNKRSKKSTVRTLESIIIAQVGDEIRFTYCGNGFLYHMVRILTGTLLEIGTGVKSADAVSGIMESGLRENAGPLIPPQGLTLIKVEY